MSQNSISSIPVPTEYARNLNSILSSSPELKDFSDEKTIEWILVRKMFDIPRKDSRFKKSRLILSLMLPEPSTSIYEPLNSLIDDGDDNYVIYTEYMLAKSLVIEEDWSAIRRLKRFFDDYSELKAYGDTNLDDTFSTTESDDNNSDSDSDTDVDSDVDITTVVTTDIVDVDTAADTIVGTDVAVSDTVAADVVMADTGTGTDIVMADTDAAIVAVVDNKVSYKKINKDIKMLMNIYSQMTETYDIKGQDEGENTLVKSCSEESFVKISDKGDNTDENSNVDNYSVCDEEEGGEADDEDGEKDKGEADEEGDGEADEEGDGEADEEGEAEGDGDGEKEEEGDGEEDGDGDDDVSVGSDELVLDEIVKHMIQHFSKGRPLLAFEIKVFGEILAKLSLENDKGVMPYIHCLRHLFKTSDDDMTDQEIMDKIESYNR